MRLTLLILTISLIVIFAQGCSSGLNNPVQQSNNPENEIILPITDVDETQTSRTLLGIWTVRLNPDNCEVELVPYRSADVHWNVAPLIPVPSVHINEWITYRRVDLDITITNPAPVDVYDVRLVYYTMENGQKIDDYLQKNLTPLYQIPGSDVVNPYIPFAADQPNRTFESLTQHTENTRLYLPENSDPVAFAIDASIGGNCEEPYLMDNLIKEKIYTEIGSKSNMHVDIYDWQDNAGPVYLHCPSITGEQLSEFTQINAETWELELVNRQAPQHSSHDAYIIAYSDDSGPLALYDQIDLYVFNGGVPPEWDSTIGVTDAIPGNGEVTVHWGTATDELSPPVWYGVFKDIDSDPFDQAPIIRATNDPISFTGLLEGETYYFAVRCFDSHDPPSIDGNTVVLSASPTGPGNYWAGSIGGIVNQDKCNAIVTDQSGNVYITGEFVGDADFNPGPGEDIHSSGRNRPDAFFIKFDQFGNYQWGHSWGGSGNFDDAYGRGLAVDSSGNIYVKGSFSGTVDFDPGPGVEERTGSSFWGDLYVSKFDPEGNFIWVNACHAEEEFDSSGGICIDSSNRIFITGRFEDTVDFNPGSGIDEHTSNGARDTFLSIYDQDGNYIRTRTWGGTNNDAGTAIAVDNSGIVFVTGYYCGTVDFNPGPGEDYHTANGSLYDIYLSKFDNIGGFFWAKTWGGEGYWDESYGVATDSQGSVYVSGKFEETVDFDPGPGVVERTALGSYAAYVSKLFTSGAFQWVGTWGEDSYAYANCLFIDNVDNIYITGKFQDTVDFDPGLGVYELTALGHDIYVNKLDSGGNFIWAKRFGASWIDVGICIADGGAGDILLGGSFQTYGDLAYVDFDPGPGFNPQISNGMSDAFFAKIVN